MIKEFREKSRFTQSEAAKKLGINVGFWCRVESGAVDLPPKHYKRVSKLFSIPLTKLVNLRVTKFEHDLRTQIGHTKPK